jgi:hypothetical protein
MGAPKTFDPSKVSVLYGGAIMGGFADGTFVSVEYSSDFFSKVTGVDKFTTRVKSNDFSGSITLTLQQSSPSNDILTGFMLADKLTNKSVLPLLIKDFSGTTLVFTAYAWIRKPPTVEFGKELSNREWIFDCAELDVFVGGNNS